MASVIMRSIFGRKMKIFAGEYLLRYIAYRYLTGKNVAYANLRGHRMAVYANDWIGLNVFVDGEYEKQELQDIYDLIEHCGCDISNAVAVDVGANIGNHSISFSKKFSKVYSFEPNPHTFKLLSFNADYVLNVVPLNFGLSDKNDVLNMTENVINFGGSSVVHRQSGESIEIKVKQLDEFIDELGCVKLIKIDVEGMEYEVLQGARQTIIKNNPFIVLEQHSSEFLDDYSETNAIQLLRGMGYELCWVDRGIHYRFWLPRRLANLYNIFIKKEVTRKIVTKSIVPRDNYPMLFAVPRVYLSRS